MRGMGFRSGVLVAVTLGIAGLTSSVSTPVFSQEAEKAAPYKTVEPRPGETCLVCNQAVSSTDRVYEVDGQRAPVHQGACERAFTQAAYRYLGKLKPRGAFLGAEPSARPNLSPGWLLFGTYVLLGLLFGALCGYRALNRCLQPAPWFFAGFFFNLLGYLALLTRPAGDRTLAPAGLPPGLVKIPTTYSPRRCPGCGEMQHPSAARCTACGGKLEPLVASEVSKVGPQPGTAV